MAEFTPTFEQEEHYLLLLKEGLTKAGDPASVYTVEELKQQIADQETKVATMRDAILEEINQRYR